MTNKLVVIINSLKVRKIEIILLHETKFLVLNYSCLQNRPQIPVLSVLCPQLNLLNPPTRKNSWVRHCFALLCTWLGGGKKHIKIVCRIEQYVLTINKV